MSGPYTQEQYQRAKASLVDPKLPEQSRQIRTQRIAEFEDNQARHQPTAEAVAVEKAKPEPKLPQPGEKGVWIPNRPVTALDYVSSEVGGNLKNWEEPTVESYVRGVFEPQREQAIREGIMAQANLSKYGAAAFAPDALMRFTLALATGKAAETQTPDKITEDDPGYKAFADQQWQQEVQKHVADPEAGPLQRVSKTEGWPGTLARASAWGMGAPKAAAKGFMDTVTLGADKFLTIPKDWSAAGYNAHMAMMPPGAMAAVAPEAPTHLDAGENTSFAEAAERHPYAAAGGAMAGMAVPGGGGATLFRSVYGPTRLALGGGKLARLAAGAAGGAVTTAAQGAVEDAADPQSLSWSDEGALRGLAERTGNRLLLGGATGAGGEALAQGAGAVKNLIANGAARRFSRPVYNLLERAGYKFRVGLGPKESPEALQAWRASAESPDGMSPAEAIARRTRGPINDNIQAMDETAQGEMTEGLNKYLGSTSKRVPVTGAWNSLVDSLQMLGEEQAPAIQKKIIQFSDIDIVPGNPPKKWGRNTTYMSIDQAKALGVTPAHLSPDAQAAWAMQDPENGPTFLKLTPRKMDAGEFYTKTRGISDDAAQAEKMKDSQLAGAWRRVEAAALGDRERFPITKSVSDLTAEVPAGPGETRTVRGFPALQQQHSEQITKIQSIRDLSGATGGDRTSRLREHQLDPLTSKIMNSGKPGSMVAGETVRQEFAPPDVRKELDTLTAMNMAHAISGTASPEGLATVRGRVGAIGRFAVPRLYALGKGLSDEAGPDLPISDKLWTWLNARAPRATMFLPGMGNAQIAQIIAKQDELSKRPKKLSDLSPEQQQVLKQAMGQGAPQ